MDLKELRQLKNIKQVAISEELKIKNNTYSQYETGKREPSISVLPKLAEILNCSIEEVVFAIINSQQG